MEENKPLEFDFDSNSNEKIDLSFMDNFGNHEPEGNIEVQDNTFVNDSDMLGASNDNNTYETNESKPEQLGLVGLRNLGNTCFMNSGLQCLFNSPLLVKFFLTTDYLDTINYENKIGTNGELSRTFGNLVEEYWSGNTDIIAPQQFKFVLGKFAKQFLGFGQQDSQEMLSFLLDGLHEDFNQIVNKPFTQKVVGNGEKDDESVAQKSWKVYKQRNDSIISDLFNGQLKSKLKCSDCDNLSITFDTFTFLSLPIATSKSFKFIISVRPKDASKKVCEYYIKSKIKLGIDGILTKLEQLTDIPKNKLILTRGSLHKISEFIQNDHQLFGITPRDKLIAYEYEVFLTNGLKSNKGKQNENGNGNGNGNENGNQKGNEKEKEKKIENKNENKNEKEKKNTNDEKQNQILNNETKNEEIKTKETILEKKDENKKPKTKPKQKTFTIVPILLKKLYPVKSRNQKLIKEKSFIDPIVLALEVGKVPYKKLYNKILEYIEGWIRKELLPTEEEDKIAYKKWIRIRRRKRQALEKKKKLEREKAEKRREEQRKKQYEIRMRRMKKINDLKKQRESQTNLYSEEKSEINCNNNTRETEEETNKENDNKNSNHENGKFQISANTNIQENNKIVDDKQNETKDDNKQNNKTTNTTTTINNNNNNKNNKNNQANNNNNENVNMKIHINLTFKENIEEGKKIILNLNLLEERPKKTKTSKKTISTNNKKKKNLRINNKSKLETIWSKWGFGDNVYRPFFKIVKLNRFGTMPIKKYTQKDSILIQKNTLLGIQFNPNLFKGPKYIIPLKKITAISQHESARKIHKNQESLISKDLGLKKIPNIEEMKPIELNKCLNQFIKEEQLSEQDKWFCPKCKKHVCTWKKLDLWKLPKILIIHLKRFALYSRSKIDKFINFPLTLNLDEYVLNKNQKNSNSIYKLIAISNHYGGTGGGHYTAFAKNMVTEEWYEYDDQKVNKIDNIENIKTKAAYVLFYQRFDQENGKLPLESVLGENAIDLVLEFEKQMENSNQDLQDPQDYFYDNQDDDEEDDLPTMNHQSNFELPSFLESMDNNSNQPEITNQENKDIVDEY